MPRKIKNKNKPKTRSDSTAYSKNDWYGPGRRNRKRNKPTLTGKKQGNNGSGGVPNTMTTAIENNENVSNLDIFDNNSYLSQ